LGVSRRYSSVSIDTRITPMQIVIVMNIASVSNAIAPPTSVEARCR
jgi:hypothetical protein